MDRSLYIRKLIEYFKKNLSKGYTLESLRWALINQGYSRVEVSKAIELVHLELAKEAPKLVEKPVIKYEVLDETNTPITVEKKVWWKRLLGV